MTAVWVDSGWGEPFEASVLDLSHWGHAATGRDKRQAVAGLRGREYDDFKSFLERHRSACAPLADVRIVGRDDYESWCRAPATMDERRCTLQFFQWSRDELVELIAAATDAELDFDDPDRVLPADAWWRTPRQMAYHIAITASRYYLTMLGVDPPEGWARSGLVWKEWPDVLDAVQQSTRQVLETVPDIPLDLVVTNSEWDIFSARRCLWQLASHERRETNVVRQLLEKARVRRDG